MTKRVRIENADTSDFRVVVQIYEKNHAGEPDLLIDEVSLDHPTAMLENYLTSTRYLVIREKTP